MPFRRCAWTFAHGMPAVLTGQCVTRSRRAWSLGGRPRIARLGRMWTESRAFGTHAAAPSGDGSVVHRRGSRPGSDERERVAAAVLKQVRLGRIGDDPVVRSLQVPVKLAACVPHDLEVHQASSGLDWTLLDARRRHTMPRLPSIALQQWLDERVPLLDEVRAAHTAIAGPTRGRKYATQQVNQAYLLMVAGQFQGFCRDLHTEATDYL